ncbi:MAG: Acyl-CoA dehydrogenase, short-chain specific [Acidimicrobiales bacterium]|nr:Acyl-CoA dehydrogenase, short-chain specific [Acidimicrobiales bacterium]
MDAETREMYRKTLGGLMRRVGAEGAGESDVVAELRELGWDELTVEEPTESVALLFEEQGAALVASRALDMVVAAALGLDDRSVGIAYPEPGPTNVTSAINDDGRLTIAGLLLGASEAAEIAVPAQAGTGVVVAIVSRGALSVVEMEGFDDAAGFTRVTGVVEARHYRLLDGAAWAVAVAAGRRALAHELVGLASHMIDRAAGYVIEREQFGRPLGTFQAVQHRLADAYTGLVAARSVLAAIEPDDVLFGSLVAKAVAGRAAIRAAHSCTQVTGAIGCTWEYELHRYLRRTHALDALLGSWRALRKAIGQQMAEDGHAARLGSAPEGPAA